MLLQQVLWGCKRLCSGSAVKGLGLLFRVGQASQVLLVLLEYLLMLLEYSEGVRHRGGPSCWQGNKVYRQLWSQSSQADWRAAGSDEAG